MIGRNTRWQIRDELVGEFFREADRIPQRLESRGTVARAIEAQVEEIRRTGSWRAVCAVTSICLAAIADCREPRGPEPAEIVGGGKGSRQGAKAREEQ